MIDMAFNLFQPLADRKQLQTPTIQSRPKTADPFQLQSIHLQQQQQQQQQQQTQLQQSPQAQQQGVPRQISSGKLYKGNILSKPFSAKNRPDSRQQQQQQQNQQQLHYNQQALQQIQQNLLAIEPLNKRVKSATAGVNTRVSQANEQGFNVFKASLEFNLIESEIYPSIYFAKTSLRNLLKEIKYPAQIKALQVDDQRLGHIFKIISKLFNEISFELFNIIVAQHAITHNYFVFFSDTEQIPFSKCCNSPVYTEVTQSGAGRILCNDPRCASSLLTEFTINYTEEQQHLWKTKLSGPTHQHLESEFMRRQVSKMITAGQFKHLSIAKKVKKLARPSTSMPQNQFLRIKQQQQQRENSYQPFLTGLDIDSSNLNNNNNNNQIPQKSKTLHNNENNEGGGSLAGASKYVDPEFQDFQFQNPLSQQQLYQSEFEEGSGSQQFTSSIARNQQQQFKHQQSAAQDMKRLNDGALTGLMTSGTIFSKNFSSSTNKNGVMQLQTSKSVQQALQYQQHLQKQRNPTGGSLHKLTTLESKGGGSSQYSQYQPQQHSNSQIESNPQIKLRSGYKQTTMPQQSSSNQAVSSKKFMKRGQSAVNYQQTTTLADQDRSLLDIKNMINELLPKANNSQTARPTYTQNSFVNQSRQIQYQ